MAHIRDGVAIIGVNSLHAPNRQRFTVAHELAHIILHRDVLESSVHVDRVLLRDRNSSSGTDDREIVANAFASELLVPTDLLQSMLGGRDVVVDDDDEIATLARKFRLSESAMRYRLFQSGPDEPVSEIRGWAIVAYLDRPQLPQFLRSKLPEHRLRMFLRERKLVAHRAVWIS